jgi:hypothetical protein
MAVRRSGSGDTWRVGDAVEVRRLDEIMATLDRNGELDGLPFMPEMVPYCGGRLTVGKVAHKVCDTVSKSGMRRMTGAVHLAETRCDGAAHGGCQAACLMYWKTAWLKKVDPSSPPSAPGGPPTAPAVLVEASRREPVDGGERYRCQATELARAAPQRLRLRDLRQYVQDVRSGNASVLWVLRAFLVGVYNQLEGRIRRRLPDSLKDLGPRQWGAIQGRPGPTPTGRIDLRPGELVRIRSRQQVAETLDERHLNRGMGFDAEMARFCGQTGRVARRVDHIIDEGSGRMLTMKEPCVVLEGLVCEGAYNASCPRSITPYWREIWLERTDGPAPPALPDGGT